MFTIIETAKETMTEIDIKTITFTILGKDDIKTELQLNNVIYALKMNSNLFSLMTIYDKSYETRITSGYDLRIFHEETLIAIMIKVQRELFRLKTIIDSYTMTAIHIPETTLELNINI